MRHGVNNGSHAACSLTHDRNNNRGNPSSGVGRQSPPTLGTLLKKKGRGIEASNRRPPRIRHVVPVRVSRGVVVPPSKNPSYGYLDSLERGFVCCNFLCLCFFFSRKVLTSTPDRAAMSGTAPCRAVAPARRSVHGGPRRHASARERFATTRGDQVRRHAATTTNSSTTGGTAGWRRRRTPPGEALQRASASLNDGDALNASSAHVVRHFVNLKNGIEAVPDLESMGWDYDFVRVQSTSKERRRPGTDRKRARGRFVSGTPAPLRTRRGSAGLCGFARRRAANALRRRAGMPRPPSLQPDTSSTSLRKRHETRNYFVYKIASSEQRSERTRL